MSVYSLQLYFSFASKTMYRRSLGPPWNLKCLMPPWMTVFAKNMLKSRHARSCIYIHSTITVHSEQIMLSYETAVI